MFRIRQATKSGWIECCNGGVADLSFPNSKTRRGRVEDGGQICPTITGAGGLYRLITTVNGEDYEVRIRKLTEDECYVLMGLTMEDARKCKGVGVSKTHLYKTAGNAIVCSCIELLMEHLYKAQYDDNYECFDEKFLRENGGN